MNASSEWLCMCPFDGERFAKVKLLLNWYRQVGVPTKSFFKPNSPNQVSSNKVSWISYLGVIIVAIMQELENWRIRFKTFLLASQLCLYQSSNNFTLANLLSK